MSDTAVHCIVEGRVQGVGFRYATRDVARRKGLAGWVRNRADGSVEALVQGPAEPVAEMLEWLKDGPRFASVTSLDATPVEVDAGLSGFDIRF